MPPATIGLGIVIFVMILFPDRIRPSRISPPDTPLRTITAPHLTDIIITIITTCTIEHGCGQVHIVSTSHIVSIMRIVPSRCMVTVVLVSCIVRVTHIVVVVRAHSLRGGTIGKVIAIGPCAGRVRW